MNFSTLNFTIKILSLTIIHPSKKKITIIQSKNIFFYLSKKKINLSKNGLFNYQDNFQNNFFFINKTLMICIFHYVTKRSNWMLD